MAFGDYNNLISSYGAANAYASAPSQVQKNPFSNGASVWTQPAVETGATQEFGKTQKTGAGQGLQNELNLIGSLKSRADFENGLGGTNNPDDHKIFYAA